MLAPAYRSLYSKYSSLLTSGDTDGQKDEVTDTNEQTKVQAEDEY
jgi:hypothetical protein